MTKTRRGRKKFDWGKPKKKASESKRPRNKHGIPIQKDRVSRHERRNEPEEQ